MPRARGELPWPRNFKNTFYYVGRLVVLAAGTAAIRTAKEQVWALR